MFRNALRATCRVLRQSEKCVERCACEAGNATNFSEVYSHHRTILPYLKETPVIDPTVYVAANASVVGKVSISTGSAVWYGAVVRGDSNEVRIGTESHIQDRTVVSGVEKGDNDMPGFVRIGNNVVVGYGSVLSGCCIDDNCRIGAGCRVLQGAHMEADSCLAPGSVVEQGKHIPAGEYWAGNPAKFVRKMGEHEKEENLQYSRDCTELSEKHAAEFLPYGTLYRHNEN